MLAAAILICPLILAGCEQASAPSSPQNNSASSSEAPQSSPGSPSRSDSLARIQQAVASKQLDRAEELAREFLLSHPNDMEGGVVLATILYQRGRPEEAANALLDFADADPAQGVMLRAQAAEWLFDSGQHDRALALLDKTVQQHPNQIAIRHRLAEMFNARGIRHKANQELRYLLGRTTLSIRELVALLNPTATWTTFPAKPDIHSKEEIARYGALNIVAALRSNGEVRDALALLQQLADIPDQHPAIIAELGWLLTLNQDYQSAEQWLQETDDAAQQYPAYWLAVGNLALHQRDRVAQDAFLRAMEMEPNCTEAVDGLVQCGGVFDDENIASRFRQRRLQLAETQDLAKEIAKSSPPNVQLAAEMSKLLSRIGRPTEGLAWQETAYASLSGRSPQLVALRQHQQKVLASLPSGMQRNKVMVETEPPRLGNWNVRRAEMLQNSVSEDPNAKTDLPSPDAQAPQHQPVFVNVAAETGLDFQYRNAETTVRKEFRLFEALGSGVACLDYDLDGYPDFYLGQAGGEPPKENSTLSDKLFRQQDDRFEDRTVVAGVKEGSYTLGVSSGDWNQDGWPDLLVGNLGRNVLLINQADGTFEACQGDEAWRAERFTSSIAIADITGDHLPEIVEITYVDDQRVYEPIEYHPDGTPVLLPGPKHFAPGRDWTFSNSSNGSLIGKPLGADDQYASTGLGLLITNLDDDKENEVFVANDQNANHHWDFGKVTDSNDSNTEKKTGVSKTWLETAVLRGCAFGSGGRPMACMGIAPADYDHNGKVDLHITNFNEECSNLYLQRDDGLFVDQAIRYGMDVPTVEMVGFGTQPIDFDNDRWMDLVIGNGHIEDFSERGKPFEMPTQILHRTAERFLLTDVQGDSQYWRSNHLARGVALCDWNRDGLVDTAISDLAEPFALLENRTETQNATLQLELIGTRSERDAIGCEVHVRCNDQSSHFVVATGDGYLSKNESVLFIGLGQASEIESLTISWPAGGEQTFYNLPVDQRIVVVESKSASEPPWIRSKIRSK